jgi:hypothetical protein
MFRLHGVLGFLKHRLNYTFSQVLDFCNTIPGKNDIDSDIVWLDSNDIEKYIGSDIMRTLECEVVKY